MKYTIYEPHEIEIPDEKLPELEMMIRAELGLFPDEEVFDDDILTKAEEEGIIKLPESWET